MHLNTYQIQSQINRYSPYRELASLSEAPYIPFFSLLNNESLGYPYREESPGVFGITGHQFAAKTALNFRLHPVFAPIRLAEIALRRNNINLLLPDNLLRDISPEHLPYLDDIDRMGNSFYQCLLTLAVIYRNTQAVQLILNNYDVSPDKGMEAALGESNPHMVILLLQHGAKTGTHLHSALIKRNPSELIVCILLHYGADQSLKLGNTGDNALSCAMKIKSAIRKPFLDLLSCEQITLSDSEIKILENEQSPDHKYSLAYVREHGNSLLTQISQRDTEASETHIYELIKEMSSESFNFIVSAYIAIQKTEYHKHPNGEKVFRELRKALFHCNFKISVYDHLYIRALSNAYPEDRNKLLHIIASLKTELGLATIKLETPDTNIGIYGRMRRGEPAFLETYKIEYPDTFEQYEVDSGELLLRFMPCNSFTLADEMLNAFCKLTAALTKGQIPFTDEKLKVFLGSLLAEIRYDLGERLNGLWCIYKDDVLPSEGWHEYVHLTSIMCVAWLVYLHENKPEWISEIFIENLSKTEHSDPKRKLRRIIDNALSKLSSFKLTSRRNGSVFTLNAVEMLRAAGLGDYINQVEHRRFKKLWDSILGNYKELIKTDEPVLMECRQRFSPSIAMIGDLYVTERVKRVLNTQ